MEKSVSVNFWVILRNTVEWERFPAIRKCRGNLLKTIRWILWVHRKYCFRESPVQHSESDCSRHLDWMVISTPKIRCLMFLLSRKSVLHRVRSVERVSARSSHSTLRLVLRSSGSMSRINIDYTKWRFQIDSRVPRQHSNRRLFVFSVYIIWIWRILSVQAWLERLIDSESTSTGGVNFIYNSLKWIWQVYLRTKSYIFSPRAKHRAEKFGNSPAFSTGAFKFVLSGCKNCST